MTGLLDTLMSTTGGLLSGVTGGNGLMSGLSNGQILHGGLIQSVQTKLPANGMLSQRLTTLNSRITTAQSKPTIVEKIQALASPSGAPLLGGISNKETFTMYNASPPPISSDIATQSTFILR